MSGLGSFKSITMYKNKFDQKFPFFNLYDEKALVKELKKNPTIVFQDYSSKDRIYLMTVSSTFRFTLLEHLPKSGINKEYLNRVWLSGNGNYYIEGNDLQELKSFAIKLYKRHRTRFLNQYLK